MNRNDFGLWGADLSREKFSQAVAALGVVFGEGLSPKIRSERVPAEIIVENILSLLQQNRPLSWHIGWYWLDSSYPKYWLRDLELLPAEILAEAWQRIIKESGENIGEGYFAPDQSRIRLVVYHDDERAGMSMKPDVLWIIEQLSRPEVQAASVYGFINDPMTNVTWDFPLRIGLLGGTASRKLRDEIETHEFEGEPLVKRYIKIVDVKAGNSDCDILLLPHNLRSAVAALLRSPNSLRADLVIVTGKINESEERVLPLVESLRTQARAAGVCLVPVSSAAVEKTGLNERQIWFKNLIRQITHNEPVDVALFRACRDREISVVAPTLFAAPQLIAASRISRRLDQFRERLAQPNLKNVEIKISDAEFESILVSKNNLDYRDVYSLNDVSEALRDSDREFSWRRESDMATTFSEVKREAEAALETAPPPVPKSRWINAEIWELSKGERRRSALNDAGFRAETDYEVTVFIGQPSQNSISASEPFNDEALPPGKNEHELIVIFTEPEISPEPKVAKIVLPRKGDSTHCSFFIRVPEKVRNIRARISVVYRNRVLQTALLAAPVLGAEETGERQGKIELLIESVIRPGLQDLTERRWFDAALIVNHDQAGTPQVTRIVGEKAELISIEELGETIKWFDNLISRIADEGEKFGALGSKKSVELLRICADKGVALLKGLMDGRSEGAFAAAERIQLLTARKGARFPLEFIYGRTAPDEDAKLCKNAAKALLKGRCGANCPTGEDEEARTICPLGFWGLNRVIERHAYDAAVLKEMSADFALQSEPFEGRTRLNILTKAVVAASQKVDAVDVGSSQKVFDALDVATKNQSKTVASWTDWKADIKTRSPSLLVLLPHTLTNSVTHISSLEISATERLPFTKLNAGYVLGQTKETRPVVILMGCKTNAPDFPYENFVSEFRRLGAAIVVGTGSTILGHHAAPVTSELIKALAAVSSGEGGGIVFGDVMLDIRRRMVADGLLMALCLTSYGDTDWII